MTPSAPTRKHTSTRWDPQLVQMVNEVFFENLKPRKIRTQREFAEAEIVLPDGCCEGLKFRCDRVPFSGEVLDIFDSGIYNRFFAQASRQTMKTLLFFQIPLMYHLFEMKEDVIIGVPKIQLAQEIYERRIKPMIERSRYAKYLPKKGAGSRGGTNVTNLTFGNGARLLFMAKGHTHTARVVIFTEIYLMQEISSNSQESNPYRQIEKCTQSFGGAKRIYGESIVTVEHGGVWDEVALGTDTKVFLKCKYCGGYVTGDRKNFSGWETAETDKEASRSAYYICQHCEKHWNQRRDHQYAVDNYLLVHKDQTINKKGKIKGKVPDTYTFGITYNRMNTTLIPKKTDITVMGDIAVEEWQASRSDDPADEVAVSQYVWAEPIKGGLGSDRIITSDSIYNKISKWDYGTVPEGAEEIVVGLDIGETWHWWLALALRRSTAEGFIIDYGSIPVQSKTQDTGIAIYQALEILRDNELRRGWRSEGRMIAPSLVMVDSGYGDYVDEVYTFCKKSGKIYIPTKGFGTSSRMPAWGNQKKSATLRPGNNWRLAFQAKARVWLLEMNTDHWKTRVRDRILAAPNTPGSIYLYNAPPQEHTDLVRHLMAEKKKTILLSGNKGGVAEIWTHPNGRPNHWNDCLYEALVGADKLGILTMPLDVNKARQKERNRRDRNRSQGWINRGGSQATRSSKGGWLKR